MLSSLCSSGRISLSRDRRHTLKINGNGFRIGNDVIFRGVKPCTRCIFTNINPESGERHPKREPLQTLIKERSIIPGESPVMGLHMGIRVPGHVSIGDAVYTNDESED